MKNEVLLAIVEKLIQDSILEHSLNQPSLRGPRGLPGKDAKDFCFDDHKEIITDIIKANIPSVKDGEKGEKGDPGAPGKDFIFEEHSNKIFSYIDNLKESLKLKFSDLTEGEIKSLRGEKGDKGSPGRPGRDFIFEEHSEEIFKFIENVFNSIKNTLKLKFEDLTEEDKISLKLKFEDLTEEEVLKLRGPRGQRGKQGRDFNFEDHRDLINDLIVSHITSIKDQLKGADGKSIRGAIGPSGINGKDGKDGKDGEDGKDAPVITDIEIEQQRDKSFRFSFKFDNGDLIETNKVDLPIIDNSSSSYIVMEADGGISANIVIPNVICDPTVYVGAAVRMLGDGTCVNALADTYENANVIGICQSKETETLCMVRVLGVLPELYTGLDISKEYYLSATVPGGISTDFPTVSGQIKLKLGQPFSTKKLFVVKGERVVRG